MEFSIDSGIYASNQSLTLYYNGAVADQIYIPNMTRLEYLARKGSASTTFVFRKE